MNHHHLDRTVEPETTEKAGQRADVEDPATVACQHACQQTAALARSTNIDGKNNFFKAFLAAQ